MATRHVAVRLEEEVLSKVDALIPKFSKPWRTAKRSDVLRALIVAGLAAHDRGELDFDRPASFSIDEEEEEEAPAAKPGGARRGEPPAGDEPAGAKRSKRRAPRRP